MYKFDPSQRDNALGIPGLALLNVKDLETASLLGGYVFAKIVSIIFIVKILRI